MSEDPDPAEPRMCNGSADRELSSEQKSFSFIRGADEASRILSAIKSSRQLLIWSKSRIPYGRNIRRKTAMALENSKILVAIR
jgi:hypothetical protein